MHYTNYFYKYINLNFFNFKMIKFNNLIKFPYYLKF